MCNADTDDVDQHKTDVHPEAPAGAATGTATPAGDNQNPQ